jgi:NADH:ubiquinone oxidoreductase subunit F (NADH-binding)
MTQTKWLSKSKTSGLRGQWSWFPAGMKWSFIDKNQENQGI